VCVCVCVCKVWPGITENSTTAFPLMFSHCWLGIKDEVMAWFLSGARYK